MCSDAFKYSLYHYWQDNTDHLDQQRKSFQNYEKTKIYRDRIKEKIQSSTPDKNLEDMAQVLQLLYRFEQDLNKKTKACDASHDRELAFHLIDWIPAFTGKVPTSIIIQLFYQAGLSLQLAAQQEQRPAVKMADEQMALQFYLLTINLAHHFTPDIEIYHLAHALKAIVSFQYVTHELTTLVPALQNRIFLLSDIWPFIQPLKAPIDHLTKSESLLTFMQKHLKLLVSLVMMQPDIEEEEYPLYLLSPTHILYRAYEGTIKGWYDADAVTSENFRLQLMALFLNDYAFGFDEVEGNLTFTQSTVQQDADGWIQAVDVGAIAPFKPDHHLKSIVGINIHLKKGTIEWLVIPCEKNTPNHLRVLQKQDCVELIHKNIGAALFSLDPIDPNVDYHPFQTMWFSPTRLQGSRLLETLLSSDYLLKAFSIGQAIQHVFPFVGQPLSALIQYLPDHLKAIMHRFHDAQHSESIHRFWIEAQNAPVFFQEPDSDTDQQTIYCDTVDMIVRKHLMRRTPDGQLIDDEEHHEGWFIYFFSDAIENAWREGELFIQQPAILFRINSDDWNSSLMVEQNQEQEVSLLEEEIMLCDQLRQCPRDDITGRVIDIPQTESLMYQLTCSMTNRINKPHYFTPEYIFAQEFTQHYSEFAIYFPELKRLQELSRLLVLVRILNGIQQGNQDTISQIEEEVKQLKQWLNRSSHPISEDNAYVTRYQSAHHEFNESIRQQFREWGDKLNFQTVYTQKETLLRDLRRDIGDFNFRTDSPEVNEACETVLRDATRRYQHFSYSEIRDQVERERYTIAHTLSQQKKKAVEKLLNQKFSKLASRSDIQDFLDNNRYQPMATALSHHEINENKKQIIKEFKLSPRELDEALDGNQAVITAITTRIATKEFTNEVKKAEQALKQQKQMRLKLEKSIHATGLGRDEAEVDLEGHCLWVPANMKKEIGLAEHPNRFVYGGVSLQARIIEMKGAPPGSLSNARNMTTQQMGTTSRGGGGSGGNHAGGGNSGGTGISRFTMIAKNVSKAEARTILNSRNHGLAPAQVSAIKKTLSSGAMDNVNIKQMNNGDTRVICERLGHTNGYQRMSYAFDVSGNRLGVVQTAYNDQGQLVHQRPGQAKNNIYDIKYWWK